MSRLLELGFACARLLARVSLPHHSFACLRPRVRFRFFRAPLTGMTLTFSFGWPNAPVGNFHPARLPTCRAHERGIYAASPWNFEETVGFFQRSLYCSHSEAA